MMHRICLLPLSCLLLLTFIALCEGETIENSFYTVNVRGDENWKHWYTEIVPKATTGLDFLAFRAGLIVTNGQEMLNGTSLVKADITGGAAITSVPPSDWVPGAIGSSVTMSENFNNATGSAYVVLVDKPVDADFEFVKDGKQEKHTWPVKPESVKFGFQLDNWKFSHPDSVFSIDVTVLLVAGVEELTDLLIAAGGNFDNVINVRLPQKNMLRNNITATFLAGAMNGTSIEFFYQTFAVGDDVDFIKVTEDTIVTIDSTFTQTPEILDCYGYYNKSRFSCLGFTFRFTFTKQFNTKLYYDPDFSILLNDRALEDEDEKEPFDPAGSSAVYIYVVGAVFALAVLVAVLGTTVYTFRRKLLPFYRGDRPAGQVVEVSPRKDDYSI